MSGSEALPLQDKCGQRLVNEATAAIGEDAIVEENVIVGEDAIAWTSIHDALQQLVALLPDSDMPSYDLSFAQFRIYDVNQASRLSHVYLRDRFQMAEEYIDQFIDHVNHQQNYKCLQGTYSTYT